MSQPQPPAQPYGAPVPSVPPAYGPPPGWGGQPGYPTSPAPYPAQQTSHPAPLPAYPGQQGGYPGQQGGYPGQQGGYPGQQGGYPGQQGGYPGQQGGYPGQQGGYPAAPGAYPSSPVPGQDFSGPPPAPATPYPATAAGQMPLVSCRLCGSVPAADTTFRGHQGLIYLMRFRRFEGPFCRDCGLGTFRYMTARTLVQGWYGYASFVITPITVLINLVRRNKVAGLAPPQPNPFGPSRQPMNPGKRLLARPMTWIGLAIPVVLLGLLVFAIARSGN